MHKHEQLDYVEWPANDLAATKLFFEAVFNWHFTDYGPDYSAFSTPVLSGGFYRAAQASHTEKGGALLVFYSQQIEQTQHKIIKHGGIISRPVFDFPGGCRFQFLEPSGNEFAVWSEQLCVSSVV
ncbi:VOC family protein [Salinimonas sediminis]|uniref:VOC family protein n=1 Tax=Salinimonas sediminis TaxID=2303538 RepID=A0A346NLX6_9ALTE|nr:VOC family protein [Salinimonas sediminis]AXR06533.1 VOC family protein [Salinimonas sediminis]